MIHHIVHVTEYLYSERVSTSHHDLHLLPRAMPEQRCIAEDLEVAPVPTTRRDRLDDFGNRCTYVEVIEPHNKLSITSRADVEVAPRGPLPGTSEPWEEMRDLARAGADAVTREARAYSFASPYVPRSSAARDYAAPSFAPGRPVVEAARELTARIHADFAYDSKATTIATPVDEVLALRRGVCQDFAHLQLACLRALGLPARYVSGYLVTRPPPGKPRLVGADASHAWLAVWAGEHGWIPLDPTNDVVPGEQHITVAWGRDYSDVTPVRGVIMGGGRHDLWVSVDVSPGETPPDSLDMPFIEASDGSEARISYVEAGRGPAVVLVQGIGVVGEGWRPQVEGLRDRFRLLTFDNRGIGASTLGGAPLTIEAMAADAWAVADAAGVERAHVVGHSMGGVIAQAMALARPERVASLGLLCTFAHGREAATLTAGMMWTALRTRVGTRAMRRAAFLSLVLPPAELARADRAEIAARLAPLFGHDLADQPSIVMKQLRATARYDAFDRLPALAKIPTLVLAGAEDRIARPSYGRALAAAIPGARYEEIAGAAHGVTIHAADAVNERLAAHFTS